MATVNLNLIPVDETQLVLAAGDDTQLVLSAGDETQIVLSSVAISNGLMMTDGSNSALALGSAGTPSLKFAGDANTGIFSPGADQLSVTTGGTERLRIDGAGQIEAVSLGSAAAPTFSFTGDSNTGIYSPGADQLAISTAGTGRLFVDASGNVTARASDDSTGVSLNPIGALEAWRSDGVPFIDFKSSSAEDFDCRIQQDTNGLRFLTGGNGASFERLRITSAGLVGIGTTSPAQLLHLSRSGTGDFSSIRFGNTGASGRQYDLGLGGSTTTLPGSFYVFDVTASATRFAITSAGNVGIGTTAPGDILSVTGGNVALQSTGGAGAGDRPTERSLIRSDVGSVNGLAAIGMNGAGANGFLGEIKFYTGTADLFNTSLSERARIDSSGRLLVGTSSSVWDSLVEVARVGGSQFTSHRYGANTFPPEFNFLKSRGASVGTNTIVSDGDVIGQIAFRGADGSSYIASASITASVDGTPGANDMPGRLVFSTTADGAASPTERVRIDNAGNTVLGGGSAGANGSITCYPNFAAGTAFLDWNRADTATSSNVLRFRNSAVTVGSITITNTATTYNTSSDYRLKENVVPLTGAIDRLNDLQVHRFNFIANPDTAVDGFLAHEAQAVVPECVTGTKDAVDDDGNPVYQGIDQSKLVPLLTAALQEAIAKIEVLESKVAALEAQ
jgi:hypothetical protein